MTGSKASDPADLADDQAPVAVSYGHGRMPLFMKLLWTGFLVFILTYVAVYLIPAAGEELSR